VQQWHWRGYPDAQQETIGDHGGSNDVKNNDLAANKDSSLPDSTIPKTAIPDR